MKNKKRLICLGIALLICTYLFIVVSFYSLERNENGEIKFFQLWGIFTVGAVLLSLAESMFLKAMIVPKWLRIIIYWQWIQVPVVLVITFLYAVTQENVLWV